MNKYIVTALDRTSMGHPSYSTPGRAWPSGQPVEVEVLDQEEDPTLTRMVDGHPQPYPDPQRIGARAWKRICADKKLTIRPAGENQQDVQTLFTKLSDAESAAAAAEARATLAESRVRVLESEGPDSAKKAQAEIARLEDVAAKAIAKVDEANAKAAKAMEERDELNRQLEQLTAPSADKKGKRG